MRSSLIICILLTFVMALAALAAPDRHTLLLPTDWRIQPATSPDTPPKDDIWGIIGSHDWRWGGVKNPGKEWAKTPREEINSLWYEQTIAIPADWQGRRAVIDFRRIEGDAIVFLNGARVTELQRPGGEIDLTPHIQSGKDNLLRVFLTRAYTGISRDFKNDPLRYTARNGQIPMKNWPMGITAPVKIMTRSRPVAITDVFAIPSWREKSLTLEVELESDDAVEGYTLSGEVFDADGKSVLTLTGKPFNLPAGSSIQRITAPWQNPTTWELGRGYLYKARVTLAKGETADLAPDITFGFREIWVDGRQIMMNGHPSRWHLDMMLGVNPTSLSFFRLLGYNVVQIQPNGSAWWRDWAESMLLSDDLLNAMDTQGFGATVPTPAVTWLRGTLLSDDRARKDYEREMALYLKRYRNHPCILAWAVGMGLINPRENIHADGMGRKLQEKLPNAKVIKTAGEIAKSVDPTRPIFSHGDGATGDIANSNMYLNFVPLQEREEWPSSWAADAEMPYMAAEFGQPYTANFWKGKRFLLTEYLAMYFGDAAYTREGEAGLRSTVEYGLQNTNGHGAMLKVDLKQFPVYWDFQRLFVKNTNRSWRTWGLPGGWLHWNLDTGYGDPPGFSGNIFSRYSTLKEPVTEKPLWANPNFDAHREDMQPLLAYIAGYPKFTDKTHAFYTGETMKKQVALIWDGPGEKKVTAEWILTKEGVKAIDKGVFSVSLKTGDIKFVPIEAMAPLVTERVSLRFMLTVKEGDATIATDIFPVQIFPLITASETIVFKKIVLLDPEDRSAWVKGCFPRVTPYAPGMPLKGVDLLVIGREALKNGDTLPYTPDDIARGLQVVILEQQPQIWEGMGLKTIETMPRYVFPRDTDSPILKGLLPEDLINWRGAPKLLPEYAPARSHDMPHAPKWSNTHAVASVVMQIPETAGFTPVLAAEFDMQYSPLLQWRFGAGSITFCSLDFSDRVGVDPAATTLARNLMRASSARSAQTRKVCYVGGPQGKKLLDQLQIAYAQEFSFDTPRNTLLIIGEDAQNFTPVAQEGFVMSGGIIISLPKTKAELEAMGLGTMQKSVARVEPVVNPLLRAVGPNLLRWRDPLDVTVITAPGSLKGALTYGDGLFLVQQPGKKGGARIFLQCSPASLDGRYLDDPLKREAMRMSIYRLTQLMAQIFTNAGVAVKPVVAQRLTTLITEPGYEGLGQWKVLGPYLADKDTEQVIATNYPGEDDAIAGNVNPGMAYQWNGSAAGWNHQVRENDKGYFDLAAELKTDDKIAVAYATRIVKSEKARVARLRMGANYRLKVWVNGELSYCLTTDHGPAGPKRHEFNIDLKAGDNVISIKTSGVGKGLGFWATLSTPGSDINVKPPANPEKEIDPLYLPAEKGLDPYEFTYW